MFFMEMLPYHVVPLSGVKNTQMSTAFAVVVRDRDAAPPGKRKEPPAQATVRPAVPSFARISVKDEPRFEFALDPESVNVQLPVSVAVKTVPSARLIVAAVPVLPIADTLSE